MSTVLAGGHVPTDSQWTRWLSSVRDPAFMCTFDELQLVGKCEFMSLDKVHRCLHVVDRENPTEVIVILYAQHATHYMLASQQAVSTDKTTLTNGYIALLTA